MKPMLSALALGALLAVTVDAQAPPAGPPAAPPSAQPAGVPPGAPQPMKKTPKEEKREKAESKKKGTEAKDDKKSDKDKKKEDEKKSPWSSGTFGGLAMRGIGPATVGGRIVDLAVDPTNESIYYVVSASGGVWKTVNRGTTFEPITDGIKPFSFGCITLDPNNPLVVWLGSGENNSQRSVSWGDGVYKSIDGGKSWENVGLKKSEHIGKIVVDPRDSNVVYVAAQGPLWGPGGDRGLYKTTDGGKTWNAVLTISENTGVSDLVMDPRNPDVLYAAAYQRRRHVFTLIDGGPESSIQKSTDGGKTWRKLTNGLPKDDLGRIGLALAPSRPDTVYATVESIGASSGFFRTTDGGANWERRSDTIAGSPQYYQELFVDPKNADRVYLVDVFNKVSHDGGATFENVGEDDKHVDNHVIWIDPQDTDHLLNGNDGGLYESYDRGKTWQFKPNLPLAQFYRVAVDNSLPFYFVYGGTQDNYSLGGPSRTDNNHGIRSSDWFVTNGGDGFNSQIDPVDPNIVYAESQDGGLVRFDRRSGESVDIQPQPGKGEPALRFNWDSPLLISPHLHTRIYHAANRVFQSDDRGNTWRAISPDLTRQLDKRKLKVMGKVWSAETVAYGNSTSFYGNLISFTESTLKPGLLIAGSDDGLLQITENGGGAWRKVEKLPGVPELSQVIDVEASRHDANTLYVAYNNHKDADFKPYLLKSTDLGKSWTSIAGDLPADGPLWTVVEDPVNPSLLFCGTEYGLYFTVDGGKKWIALGGLPPTAVHDIAIQQRESDLVVATFGRGFYVLDDYSPLRALKADSLDQEALLFGGRRALAYLEASPLGGDGRSFQGSSFFIAPNPPFGATFTYYLKDEIKTKKQQRRDAEKKTVKEGGELQYPSWEQLASEEREKAPRLVFTISDEDGQVVRRLTAPAKSGFQRITWDLRYPASNPARLEPPRRGPFGGNGPVGPMAAPGKYTVAMAKEVDGVVTPLGSPQPFEVASLGNGTLAAKDRESVLAFQRKVARLQRAALGVNEALEEAKRRVALVQKALFDTPGAERKLTDDARALERKLDDLDVRLNGDPVKQRRNEPTPPAVSDRVQHALFSSFGSTGEVTQTQKDDYAIGAEEFGGILAEAKRLIGVDLKALEDRLEAAGGPWTPGRLPDWKPE